MSDDTPPSEAPFPEGTEARPGRAELRRARDSAAAPAAKTSSGAVDGGTSAAAPTTRVEQRRLQRLADRESRSKRGPLGLLRAWWFYPLVVAIGVCIYLGYQSTNAPPKTGPIVVTTPGASP